MRVLLYSLNMLIYGRLQPLSSTSLHQSHTQQFAPSIYHPTNLTQWCVPAMAPVGMPLYFRSLPADQHIIFVQLQLSVLYIHHDQPVNRFIPTFRPSTAPHSMVPYVYDT